MGKSTNKLRLLYLQRILTEETSETYPLTVKDIMQRFEDVGLQADRKTIYADIQVLQEFGTDIICEKRKQNQENHYYLGQADFQLIEVKTLIDAVQFAKFITPKKTTLLIEKLCQLTNIHEAKWLKARAQLNNVTKKTNEQIYFSLDAILEAIKNQKKIEFQYLAYTSERQLAPKRQGECYCVSPYALSMYDNKYYVIAYHERYERIVSFRLDMMQNVSVSALERNQGDGQQPFQIAEYLKGAFSMMTGEKVRVDLCWHKKQMNTIMDRFGPDLFVLAETPTHLTIKVEVQISKAFYAWLVKFGSDVKIIGPTQIQDEFLAQLHQIITQYQE